MSAIDWDGNLTHANFNKPKIANKTRAKKMATSAKNFDMDFDDDNDKQEQEQQPISSTIMTQSA